MRNKTVAAVFAIFLGWLGIHCFYLGKKVRGIIYLLISVMSCIIGCICYLTAMSNFLFINYGLLAVATLIFIAPMVLGIVSFIEGIVLLCKDQKMFDLKYNKGVHFVSQASLQMNRQSSFSHQQASPSIKNNKVDMLVELKKLLDSGVLTKEEFESEKQKILHS